MLWLQLLDIADVHAACLVLADEVDEFLFDWVHAVHAAVLYLLLVDFRKVCA